jgi:hypothetical protein
MTMWRARLLGALALAGTSALLAAAPAHAAGSWATPSGDQQVSSIPNTPFTVQWDVSHYHLDHITMTAWFVSPGQSVPDTAGRTVVPVNGQPTTTCTFPSVSTDFAAAVSSGSCSLGGFTASLNGTYYAESAGYYQECVNPPCVLGDINSPSYTVSVPPTAPSLSVSYDASAGRINVSWTKDANADDETFSLTEAVNDPNNQVTVGLSSPTATSWSRGNLTPGDTYAFAVSADRPMASGKMFPSATSAPQSVSVPAPPPPDSTTTAPGAGPSSNPAPGGTTSTTKLINPSLKPPSNYTPSKLDLSAFAKALNAAKSRANAGATGGDNGSLAGEPDTYKQSLPYGSASPNSAAEDGSQQADSPPLARVSTNAKDNVRTAAAVAGGLLAIVLAMHGMWLRSEVKRAALLEAVEPEGSDGDEFRDFWFASDDDPRGG